MLVTERAKRFVRRIPEYMQRRSAGLRIARGTGERRFQVRGAAGPEPDDHVVEEDGARVFLGPVAARELDEAVLDVHEDDQGRAQFKTRQPDDDDSA